MAYPSDPVGAFLSGIRSGVGRALLGLLAIPAGFSVCLVAQGWSLQAGVGLGPLTLGLLFYWSTYGGWALLGTLALCGIFAFLWPFVHEWHPKASLFGMFTSAVAYYLPITFLAGRWPRALGIWAGIGCLYWLSPLLARRARV